MNINLTFILYNYDVDNDVYKLSYCNQSTASSILSHIDVDKVLINCSKKKSANLWYIVKGYLTKFMFKGTTFYFNSPYVFNTFRGYDYKVLYDLVWT